jgi:DinB family protein
MSYNKIIQELQANCTVFNELLTGLSNEEYLWKPAPEKWCLLEIICHLYDEEIEDFKARTKSVLTSPKTPFVAINPTGWVKERDYINQNYAKTVVNFLEERKQSVNWLNSLENPLWENAFVHEKFGSMTAKLFLSNWLAHDYLHIKQLLKLKFDYLKFTTNENLLYAGGW